MPSRVFDGINTVVTILRTAGANVVDGPVVVGDSLDFVYIGYDGDPDGDWSAATMGQDWAGIGTKKRDESFNIAGAVVSRYSADDAQTARARVQAQFTIVETSVLADPSLGLPGQVQYCVADVQPIQLFAESGQYRLSFVIRVQTRI